MREINNNRRMIIRNPYQGGFKKVLCVCSAGVLRSPTAAVVLASDFNCNTRAVGLDADFAVIPIDEVLVEWADEIVCMTRDHERRIKKDFDPKAKVICLDIPDEFEYRDPKLVELIREKYQKYLDEGAF